MLIKVEFPNNNYFDEYNYNENDSNTFQRILSDANGETGPYESIKFNTQY